jgi:hypothetical protein
MGYVQLLSAAGIGGIIGSLLTTLLQAWFAHRSNLAIRNFQEKKEAYIGFLEALHHSEVERTREASLRAGHWQNRCELVAPKQVRALMDKIFDTNPVSGKPDPKRPYVIEELRKAMRADLGVTSS